MGVLWTAAIVYDRVVASVYPAGVTGVASDWSLPIAGVIPGTFPTGTISGGDSSPPAQVNSTGELWVEHGDVWFGKLIIVPQAIALGNLLSTVTRTIELFNSYGVDKDYTTFVNNAGLGITITNQPGLPATIGTFNSIVLDVEITTTGPAVINGTLDFTVGGELLLALLTGSRVVLLPARPEKPVKEILEFKTDIIEAKDGTEQRIRVRDLPRQRIEMEYFGDEDESAHIHNLFFDWLGRLWGVPIWWEERQLGADAAIGATVLTVPTDYGDFRVGGTVLVYEDQFNFEAVEIDSFTANDITLTSPLLRGHLAKDTTVLPVRFAYARPNGPSEQHLTQGQSRITVIFTTIDNVDLADASAFPTYEGQVLLDEPNLIRGTSIGENWSQRAVRHDSIAGLLVQLPRNDRSRLATRKSFYSASPQRLWEVRQLLHFLQGSVAPFYLPSFRPDMRVTVDIGASAVTMDIKNIGFTDFVAQRQPFQNLRLLLKDGTAFVRQITDSTVIDLNTERITVDSSFSGSPILIADIRRVELVALVRIKNDRVTLEHNVPGYASVSMEVVTVQFDPA